MRKWKKNSLTCGGIFDLAQKTTQVEELEAESKREDFWNDPKRAQELIKKCNSLKWWTEGYKQLKNELSDIKELYPEAKKLQDEELLSDLAKGVEGIQKKISEMEIKKMLSGEMDGKSCFVSINAGAGGTESCDWVSMLARMYERYATNKGWKVTVIDREEGDVAGIKSITFRFDGEYAYGYCRPEKGVHRLVRISPFDSNARRHTSFASVDVSPIVEDEIQIAIAPDELRVDTFRSSGAGGQHVNVTDSAVRMTHIPTGIIVSCQSERSQIQNRETCLRMLRSKLYEKQVLEREEKLSAMAGEKKEISWGHQIRSYTFQPYQLVKDARTKLETNNVQAVMDGEIENFVEAYLKEFG